MAQVDVAPGPTRHQRHLTVRSHELDTGRTVGERRRRRDHAMTLLGGCGSVRCREHRAGAASSDTSGHRPRSHLESAPPLRSTSARDVRH